MNTIYFTLPLKWILLVDDNFCNIEVLLTIVKQRFSKRFKLELKTALSGPVALKIVKDYIEENKDFDLILMDINMPIMNGFECSW